MLATRRVFPKTSSLVVTLTGLLFATHPIHTESVASIVGRAEVLYGMFALMAFLSYASAFKHAHDHINASYMPIMMSLVWTAIAVFCKEQGITVIAINAVYDFSVICELDVPTFVGMLIDSVRGGAVQVVAVDSSTGGDEDADKNEHEPDTASGAVDETVDAPVASIDGMNESSPAQVEEATTTCTETDDVTEMVKENVVSKPRLPLYVQAMLKRFMVLFAGLAVIMFFRLRMNGEEQYSDDKANRLFQFAMVVG